MRRIALLFLLFCYGCTAPDLEKINGVSFVASREPADLEHIEALRAVHAGYAAVMPFGFIREMGSPEIIFDTERQWFGETRQGARQYIDLLHKNGIRVMLKPQLWIWRGIFTGELPCITCFSPIRLHRRIPIPGYPESIPCMRA